MIGIQKELPLEQVVSDLFRDFKGDEIGGRHAMRGFNFQVWNAVLEALKAYKTGEDYAVVLEWEQDVAVLNSSSAPTKVRFIQMKKNETATHWKLHQLANPEKEETPAAANEAVGGASPPNSTSNASGGKSKKPPKPKAPKRSFLAKLYAHRRRFKKLAQSRLEFMSDANYEIPDAAGKVTKLDGIELMKLDSKIRLELEDKVRTQLELGSDEPIDFSDFGLLVSECPVSDSHKHVAGELAEMQIGSELTLTGAATMLAVLVIASYVHQRAGTKRFAKNLQELLERAVTRSDIDKYLIAANDAQVSTEEHVQVVIQRLNAELAPFGLVAGMQRVLSRVCVEITNRAGPVPPIAAHLKALYEVNAEYTAHPRVADMFAAWYNDFQNSSAPGGNLYTREYLYCLMSMIVQNANPTQQLPPVSLSSQPSDQK